MGGVGLSRPPPRFSSRRYIGRSPAGAAMMIALLIMVSATAANLAANEGTGPFAGFVAKVERPARVPGQRRPPPTPSCRPGRAD